MTVMTHTMLKGSNVPDRCRGRPGRAALDPGRRGSRRGRLRPAPRCVRAGEVGRGLRLLQPAPAPLGSGAAASEAQRSGRADGHGRGGPRGARRLGGPGRHRGLLRRGRLRTGPGPADTPVRRRVRRRRAAGGVRCAAGDRGRDGDHLRRAVPPRRGLEVPGGRPGLSHRPDRPGHRLRDLGGRVGSGGRGPGVRRGAGAGRRGVSRPPCHRLRARRRDPSRPPPPEPGPTPRPRCSISSPHYGYPPPVAPAAAAAGAQRPAYGYPQPPPRRPLWLSAARGSRRARARPPFRAARARSQFVRSPGAP